MAVVIPLSGPTLTGAGVATGPDVPIGWGSTYHLIVSCTGWNGAGAKLQILADDAVTWLDAPAEAVFAATNGMCSIDLGDGVRVRLAIITAVPTQPVYASLRRRS